MNKQFMKTPYNSLLAKKNDNSKSYFMLSELIDNSIGSWFENKMDNELQIEICINNDLKKITAEDNAFGMNENLLGSAIKMNNETSGNSLNMYGVGLKNCAFWFGMDLYIESKQEKDLGYKTSIVISKIDNYNDPVEWEVFPCKKKSTGTKISIEKIYEDKLISKREFERDILPILSTKYYKHILDNNISIKLIYIQNNEKKEHILSPKKVKAQKIEKEYKEKIIELANDKLTSTKILKDLKEKVIYNVQNNLPLEFGFQVKWNKEHDMMFTFGIQSQGSIGRDQNKQFFNNYGLTTYQGGRAINLAPLNPLPLGEYIRTNIKRVYGYVELGEIFKPDNNKREFVFGKEKERFYELIKKIGADLLILADIVFEVIGKKPKVNSGNTNIAGNKIENTLNAKTNFHWKINKSGAFVSYNDGSALNFKIYEISTNDQNANNYFINASHVEGNKNEIEIFFNIDHPIWKPLTLANMIDTKSVLYPLVSVIGLAVIDIKTEILKDLINSEEGSDFLSILNSIVRFTIQ
ncbi:ATP-binding protein [Mesoplasma seiffertii]|uniref:ATP-binding protein n=1 Tax=Mesoplasma seiffertii TaxID=28224 RepID=UPI00047B8BE3|nr:ATP-binding protein [Mesoplasma seiffertii]